MVSRRVLITDSTHLKAYVNKYKFTMEEDKKRTQEYFEEINKAIEEEYATAGSGIKVSRLF